MLKERRKEQIRRKEAESMLTNHGQRIEYPLEEEFLQNKKNILKYFKSHSFILPQAINQVYQ